MPERSKAVTRNITPPSRGQFEQHGRLTSDMASLTMYGETIIFPLSKLYTNGSYNLRTLESVRRTAMQLSADRWHTEGLLRAFEKGVI